MNNNSKGFAHLILIIGVVLVGIIGIVFIIFNNQQSATPASKTPTKPPSTLQTGIYGTTLGINDVISHPFESPYYPISDVGILTIPQIQFDNWFASLETIQSSRIIRESGIQLPVAFAQVDNKGNYNIPLEMGKYIVCFTWKGAYEDEHILNSCIEINLDENERTIIDYTVGEGGHNISCLQDSSCNQKIIPEVPNVIRTIAMDKYPAPTFKRSETISIKPYRIDYRNSETGFREITNLEFEELSKFVKENGFLNLQESYGNKKSESDYYLITIFYEDKNEKSVRCYYNDCPVEFMQVLGMIINIWTE